MEWSESSASYAAAAEPTSWHYQRKNYTAAASDDDDGDADDAAAAAAVAGPAALSPDVVANPWNTSLLWSSGVANNYDPTSNFYPAGHWSNNSIPPHLNTYPINYYYSADQIGDYLNFDFSGHGLAVLDFPGPNRSKYNVTIDNTSVVVDAYSAEDQLAKASGSQLPSSIWTSGTLYEGTHQVLITNLNDTAELQFWGVVINPENYRAGKSFANTTSNIRLVTIAASVSAVVVSLLFILGGSVFYYFKVSRPRKRLEAQIAADGGDKRLLDTRAHHRRRSSFASSRPDLRLNMHFNSSQGDLGRVPSRATATTHESQYWVRPDTGFAVSHVAAETTRPAMLQQRHTLVSSPSLQSQSQTSLVSPLREFSEREMYATASSPFTPVSPAYHTAPHHQQQQQQQHDVPSAGLVHSHSLAHKPTSPASPHPFHSLHARTQSTPAAPTDPFRDTSSVSPTGLQRNSTLRRPLPIPPVNQQHSQQEQERVVPPRIHVEQDAGSIHLSEHREDDDEDERGPNTVLPPPYSPRRMGQDFA